MTSASSTLRARQIGATITFRAEGKACMAQGLALRRRAEKALADGDRAVRIDLSDCTYMDSTFVGTLLFLKKRLDRDGGDFALVAPSAPCQALLHQMGLDDLFAVVPACVESPSDWTILSGDLGDVENCQRGVVQAHEELAHLPGPAGEAFRKVMRCLSGDK